MNTTLIRRATRLFPHTEYTTRDGVKHLRRQWVQSVTSLGEKWVLRQPVQRQETKS